jgi:hypothetical protein
MLKILRSQLSGQAILFQGNQFKLNDSLLLVEEQTLESLQPKQRKNPAQKKG